MGKFEINDNDELYPSKVMILINTKAARLACLNGFVAFTKSQFYTALLVGAILINRD